ncbi:Os03g0678000 [Oryza sativa Japonica Group]|uniref:Os03g0678000 protein n=1 Tax=Oryza sativa subsp. japonica TaxID=39947 RepID=A0A0P0W225_ORYSJ|nr:Os03g0678000 [Oryza sativa Japonica Group]
MHCSGRPSGKPWERMEWSEPAAMNGMTTQRWLPTVKEQCARSTLRCDSSAMAFASRHTSSRLARDRSRSIALMATTADPSGTHAALYTTALTPLPILHSSRYDPASSGYLAC